MLESNTLTDVYLTKNFFLNLMLHIISGYLMVSVCSKGCVMFFIGENKGVGSHCFCISAAKYFQLSIYP